VRDDRNVYPVKEGQRYINLTLAAFLFYSHPKRESDRKLVGWLEFNVPFQHKYGYIRDERDREAHLNYYGSAYRRGRQQSHHKTKLNQIQQKQACILN